MFGSMKLLARRFCECGVKGRFIQYGTERRFSYYVIQRRLEGFQIRNIHIYCIKKHSNKLQLIPTPLLPFPRHFNCTSTILLLRHRSTHKKPTKKSIGTVIPTATKRIITSKFYLSITFQVRLELAFVTPGLKLLGESVSWTRLIFSASLVVILL